VGGRGVGARDWPPPADAGVFMLMGEDGWTIMDDDGDGNDDRFDQDGYAHIYVAVTYCDLP
jgi:hypothetical protein